jgi:hypothetical protein
MLEEFGNKIWWAEGLGYSKLEEHKGVYAREGQAF